MLLRHSDLPILAGILRLIHPESKSCLPNRLGARRILSGLVSWSEREGAKQASGIAPEQSKTTNVPAALTSPAHGQLFQ